MLRIAFDQQDVLNRLADATRARDEAPPGSVPSVPSPLPFGLVPLHETLMQGDGLYCKTSTDSPPSLNVFSFSTRGYGSLPPGAPCILIPLAVDIDRGAPPPPAPPAE